MTCSPDPERSPGHGPPTLASPIRRSPMRTTRSREPGSLRVRFRPRADASSPAASDGSYPSSEASHDRLVVTMPEQQGDTSRSSGTAEILT
jgi:hypothetical protein